jgi:hypothetical protein
MTNSSARIFDTISALWDEFDARMRRLDDKRRSDACDDDGREAIESEMARVCVGKVHKTCEVAGIPYHEWAHNVHSCARSRNDRQTMDLAKDLMDQSYEHVHAYDQLCFAMMGNASSPYYKLVWGGELERESVGCLLGTRLPDCLIACISRYKISVELI